jgi:hypothetical protein
MGEHVLTGTGLAYGVGAIDPHMALAYSLPKDSALRATFDHTSVAPLPFEVQRTNSAAPAPPVALAPETADDYSFSYEHGGPTRVRLTYYAELEKNRIDVLPVNFRANPENPSAIGVPTNAGLLRSHGVEFFAKRSGWQFVANYGRTFTSSVDQFAYNDLNPAAILAGHLYPAGYVPDFTATLSREFDFLHRRLRLTPHLTAILDVINLFGAATPTQMQGNPYLIGPPGYAGGDVYYEKAYGAAYCKGCLYTLGNGVPTNNGATQVVPWQYGRAGYVPQSYPIARTAQIRLRYRL